MQKRYASWQGELALKLEVNGAFCMQMFLRSKYRFMNTPYLETCLSSTYELLT